jgi:hypothetical protein
MIQRALYGVGFVLIWFGAVAPEIEQRIQRAALEGPKPFSLQNLRDGLVDDTGAPEAAIIDAIAALTDLQQAEEERISAMWSLLDDETIQEARSRAGTLPPPRYAVDPRFFEPLVPEIIRRTIERYGAATETLESVPIRQLAGDRDDQLRIVLAAVHHKLIADEHAPALLQGAFDLLDLQMKRMELEGQLRDEFEDRSEP